ncbi:MAG: hypothetical protein Marn2KO_25180 [Marinobacter nauticus]
MAYWIAFHLITVAGAAPECHRLPVSLQALLRTIASLDKMHTAPEIAGKTINQGGGGQ